jgi:transposase
LAFVAVSKYTDALPLYRQQQIFTRLGVKMPRATLANWMIKVGQLVQPLINLLRDQVLDGDIIQMDETTVQVLNEPGRTATSTSYMWVQRGGPPDRPIILYDYEASRSGQVPLRLLAGFSGFLQTDGYDAYNAVVRAQELIGVGCMAHARRRFDEALKAQPKPDPESIAGQGLARIRQLYQIETRVKDATIAQRYQVRQTQSLPKLEQLRRWLDTVCLQVPPGSLTGKALRYLDDQWLRLIGYCQDGRLAIDNNACERAIRPFAMGRKNWLFCNTVRGAQASANLYSLVETAKACGLEPYHYLRWIFAELPKAQCGEALEVLLPQNLTAEHIAVQ